MWGETAAGTISDAQRRLGRAGRRRKPPDSAPSATVSRHALHVGDTVGGETVQEAQGLHKVSYQDEAVDVFFPLQT